MKNFPYFLLEFSTGYTIIYKLILIIEEPYEASEEGIGYRGIGDA